MLYNYLSDTGLILDIIAIMVLAKFSVPTNTLTPDGTDTLSLLSNKKSTANNINKYLRYRYITIGAYVTLVIGFLLQLSILKDLLH